MANISPHQDGGGIGRRYRARASALFFSRHPGGVAGLISAAGRRTEVQWKVILSGKQSSTTLFLWAAHLSSGGRELRPVLWIRIRIFCLDPDPKLKFWIRIQQKGKEHVNKTVNSGLFVLLDSSIE